MLRSIEKETQYLKETREYIDNLKNNLIEKILDLQRNKKTGISSKELSQKANANNLDKFLLAAGKN